MPKPRTDTERLDALDRDQFRVLCWPNYGGYLLLSPNYSQPGFYSTIREAIDAYLDEREEEK